MIDPIRLRFEVRCGAEEAFQLYTGRISEWWPLDHTVTCEPGLTVLIEGQVGGRVFERTPNGAEHEWGRIAVWEPPRRLVYEWHLRQDRADASEVEIAFVPVAPDRTRIEIEHRGWERLGSKGPSLRERNEHGWAGMLPHFVAACEDAGRRQKMAARQQ